MAKDAENMPDGFVNITSAARFLDVSRSTIYNWIQAGVLPQPYNINGQKLYQRSELAEAVKRYSAQKPDPNF
ncbi:AlpA family transcriptional regulator [Rothia sp. ZJ932]|uniref:helix-turn-helix transcriptional regulator n=1 Tax=Rothia sp. ZJ932 TaxID=2810516 RepID=UPI00196711C0|nr:helix-turn-helix domain-containing protein [Rothia sp. ZJ932]QRZ62673.1 helix-turn-helix domain-containing protein [Rothia sp. ZJ932]